VHQADNRCLIPGTSAGGIPRKLTTFITLLELKYYIFIHKITSMLLLYVTYTCIAIRLRGSVTFLSIL